MSRSSALNAFRQGAARKSNAIGVAPDLVAEVASPSEFHPEMAAKAMAWLAAGVRTVWVVWPASHMLDVWKPGTATPIHTLAAEDQLEDADLLPGLSCPMARLFA